VTNHLFDAIHEAADPAAIFIDDGKGRQWTYGDMLERSGRLANVLVDLGVVPGDRVAVQIEKSVDALMLYLACVRAGAVYLPLNTGYTPAEIDYFVGDAQPRVFVCGPRAADGMKPIMEKHGALAATMDASGDGSLAERAAGRPGDFADVKRGPDDLAAILYTSGTTGRSKGAMLSHGNLLSNALTLKDCWRFSRDDRLIHALPIFHTHGLFVATNVTLVSGSSMFLLPKFDADEAIALMGRASVMMGVPAFYVRLLQSQRLDRAATERMRLFVSGSAPLLAETHDAFRARTGHAILERYGMTETNMNTSNPYDGDRIPGSVRCPASRRASPIRRRGRRSRRATSA
jgi:malonyl-CoA/methylmalonyl-CoA synthetase